MAPKLRIVIAKADPSMAALMEKFLSPEYQVEKVLSAEECLKSMASSMPDLVLMGLVFPDAWGMDLLRRIRSEAKTASVPVVVIVSCLTECFYQEQAAELGATGFVKTPFSQEELLKSVREAWQERTMVSIARPSVLAVDDDESVLEFCKTTLESYGFTVSTARDGDEALSSLEAKRFDVILTDNVLIPTRNQTVLQAVKMRWPAMKVVVMSANPNKRYIETVSAQGACDYLAKPFLADKLLAVVRRSITPGTLGSV